MHANVQKKRKRQASDLKSAWKSSHVSELPLKTRSVQNCAECQGC